MDINIAREKIADKLSSDEVFGKWVTILGDSNPANYGVNEAEVNIGKNDIWVDMPSKTFTFKNAELVFNVRLGGSSDENGYDADFRKPISGNGKFQFINNSQDIDILEISINEHLDLY
jgi:hypothetical protein